MMNNFVKYKWIYPGFLFKATNINQFRLISFIVINEIFKPIIRNNNEKLEWKYWRYHARSSDDLTNIKLIIYTDENNFNIFKDLMEKGKDKLDEEISKTLTFADCKDQGDTDRYYEIGGSSTPTWPKELQNTFPVYIQGACDTYLRIIDEFEKSLIKQKGKLSFISYYQELYNKIKFLWYANGWGSFCHHLGACFLYEPISFRGSFPINL